jgi:hypothetical protein
LQAQWFRPVGNRAESRIGLHYATNTQNQFHIHASLCHLIPVKDTPFLAGLGFSAHVLDVSEAELLPSSRLLRSYNRPDMMYTEGFRTWNSSVFLALKMQVFSMLSFEFRTDMATVSAGKTLDLYYSTGIQQSTYAELQEAKPTLSGFRNPLFRNIGSLGSQAWIIAGLTPHLDLGIGYIRMRSEFTTSQLLNFSNDRFMLRSDMLGIRVAWKVFNRKSRIEPIPFSE